MDPILNMQGLTKHFPVERGFFSAVERRIKGGSERIVHAVCDVSLSIKNGETFGLVGESGSGKSTLARCVLRLYDITEGKIVYDGKDINEMDKQGLKEYRSKVQIVFQDPFTSLNPRKKVRSIVGHPMELHKIYKSHSEITANIEEILVKVGLSDEHMNRYPHQFSGGQKQRIAIARALAFKPNLIILDEATSALDVSIQARIINLLKNLKIEYNLTYIFISHNLDVVAYVSDRIGVMYLGKLMELAYTDDLFKSPMHPYTKALIFANPVPDPKYKKDRIILKGDIPSSISPPSGCRFHTRCPYAMDICSKEEPQMTYLGNDHYAACFLLKK